MNPYRWWHRASVGCVLLCLGGMAVARQGPGGLDPETWEGLRRSIDQQHPNMDPEPKREILRRIEKTLKLRCAIEAVTVYVDGIVCRATLRSDLPYDCRLSLQGRSLGLVCGAELTDASNNRWGVPPLKNRSSYGPLTEAETVLIGRGKTVRFVRVDKQEAPRLVRLNPPADETVERPARLRYTVMGYSMAYTADLRKYESVYLLGRGTTPVEWKDEAVPAGTRSSVIDSAMPSKN